MQNKIKEVDKVKLKDDLYRSDINSAEVGNRIRTERENLDMNRENLSELLNISPYFLGQIERGERKMSIDTLIDICECLRISMDYLFFGQLNVNNKNNIKNNSKNKNSDEIYSLINKCSEKEIEVINGIIKLILPHFKR